MNTLLSLNAKSGRMPVLWMLLLLFCGPLQAQDTGIVFTPARFFSMVRQNHPMAVQAGLQPDKADATLLKARGGFDPKLYGDLGQKQFNGTQYYSLLDAGLKIPTWYGIVFNSGFEQNRGLYLNPEHKLPDAGLWSAGVSVSVGQGLFIDERRAALRQAKIYQQSARAEQQSMLNELMYAAGKAYWDWFVSANQLRVFEDAYLLASQRFEAVKQTALLGDRPMVDTLEAGIQVQERRLSLQQARLDFRNKTLMLSVFLWDADRQPLELSSTVVPPYYQNPGTDMAALARIGPAMDSLVNNHPDLRGYAFKIQDLSIEREWKREQLKPDLRINYNPLLSSVNGLPSAYSANNYKWGMTFSMPVLLRKERGDVQITGLKIREAELEMKNKQLLLLNKAQASMNDFNVSIGQVQLYTNTVQDYESLLNAERTVFDGGESSLFMINAREMSYINAKLKLIDLTAKNQTAMLMVFYALGMLGEG